MTAIKNVTLDGEEEACFIDLVDPELDDVGPIVTISVEWVPDAHKLIINVERLSHDPTMEFHSPGVPVLNLPPEWSRP